VLLSIQQTAINEGPTMYLLPNGRSLQIFLKNERFTPIGFGRSLLGPDPEDAQKLQWMQQHSGPQAPQPAQEQRP